MTIAIHDLLKKYVPEGTLKKSIAAQWLDEMRAGNAVSLSQLTVDSRLSEALAGKKTGLQFFFGTEERSAATLRAFRIPSEERAEVLKAAKLRLGKGTPIVFNLTEQREQFLTSLFDLIRSFRDRGGLRLVILLTDAQYDEMPASLREGDFEFRRVNSGAQDELARLHEEGAVFVSRERVEPYERWLAIDGGSRAFDPPDALDRMAEKQMLDSLPAVERSLDVLCEPKKPEYWHEELPSGTRLRALLRALAFGDADTVSSLSRIREPGSRLWLAQKLGVPSSATAEEWEKAREAPSCSASELKTMLTSYRHRPEESALYRSGDVFHVFNPDEKMEKKLTSALFAGCTIVRHTERIDYDEILASARAALEALTPDDGLDDPFLWGLVQRLSGGDPVRASEMHHALMFLSGSEFRVRSSAPVVPDWEAALEELLNEVDPEARVRLPGGNGHYARSGKLKEPMMFPHGDVSVPRFDVIAARDAEVIAGSVREDHAHGWPAHLRLSIVGNNSWNHHRKEPTKIEQSKVEPDWSACDDALAVLRLSLLDALSAGRSVPLSGNRHLLPLKGGLFARVEVRKHGSPDAGVIGALHVECAKSSVSFLERFPLEIAGPDGDRFPSGPVAPRALTLRGRGFVADVTLGASALLMSPGNAGTSGFKADRDAWRRRANDD